MIQIKNLQSETTSCGEKAGLCRVKEKTLQREGGEGKIPYTNNGGGGSWVKTTKPTKEERAQKQGGEERKSTLERPKAILLPGGGVPPHLKTQKAKSLGGGGVGGWGKRNPVKPLPLTTALKKSFPPKQPFVKREKRDTLWESAPLFQNPGCEKERRKNAEPTRDRGVVKSKGRDRSEADKGAIRQGVKKGRKKRDLIGRHWETEVKGGPDQNRHHLRRGPI